MKQTLTIVVPVYNEAETVDLFYAEVKRVMSPLSSRVQTRILFVDDGSEDETKAIISKMSEVNEDVGYLSFSRNFGKEAAIFAGLSESKGECTAVMDCDLQHPPETLVEMYRLWERGFEVVEGVKRTRGKEAVTHRMATSIFYWIMSGAVKIDMSRASDFKLLDRKAVQSLLEMPERNAFFRAMSSWIGFRQTQVEFDVQEREAGESKWSTWKLISYAISNIVGYSTVPMQFVTGAGIVIFLLAVILGIQTIIRYASGHAVEGFTTVILLILLIGSVIMISLGIIGYYIARIYEETKGRPRYIISRKI